MTPPNPTRLDPTSPEDQLAAQRLDCAHRGTCLDHAARCSWPALNCGGCDAYRQATAEEQRDELEALALLGGALAKGWRRAEARLRKDGERDRRMGPRRRVMCRRPMTGGRQ